MQNKVSVVIACYNKEKYIGELLESLINQTWKEIQLIIVDDGSSDETLKIVYSFQGKLLERGIEIVVIEQENTGVAQAVRQGLEKVTGKYICIPDADDVLYKDYIERMAMKLDEDSEIDWVVCDSDRTKWTQCLSEYQDESCKTRKFENLLERYILMCNYGMVWQLMIRTEYLHMVGVKECLALLGRTTTHEAPVWIPIITGKGKGLYLPMQLYQFRDTPASLSNPGSVEKVLAYARLYRAAIVQALQFCGIRDDKYYFFAMLREYEEIFTHAPELVEYACRKLSDILIRSGHIGNIIDPNTFFAEGENPCYNFYYWIWSRFIPQLTNAPVGEVVAYGAMGIRARRMLPIWKETLWRPTMLWDKRGDGVDIGKPKYHILTEKDTVMVFPKNENVIQEIKEELKDSKACIMYEKEMEELMSEIKKQSFPTWRVNENYDLGVENA